MSNRGTFATKLGVIAAAVGSAVGLGNIWRFPYEVGQNGGGAFLVVYLAFVMILGIPLIVAEFLMGRSAQSNIGGTFDKLANGSPLWKSTAYLAIASCVLVLSFYSVIAGWTLEYIYQAVSNQFVGQDAASLATSFASFSGNAFRPLLWVAVFMGANYYIISGGVKEGIEKASNFMMPILFILLSIFCVRSIFLPGASEGLTFLFHPDFSKIDAKAVLSAMGQAFFSLSLGMGCLVTYGSYFNKETKLVRTAATVAVLDTLVAILAGVMIFPAVFSFGISPSAGPDLVFITIPNVFLQMTGGYFFAILFFILLALAALTSTVSMFEVVTAFIHEEYGWTRRKTSAVLIFAIGFLSALCSLSIGPWRDHTIFGMTVFDLFDDVSSEYLMPIGGLLVSLFVGYRLDRQLVHDQMTNAGTLSGWYVKPIIIILRYVAPLAILLIFLSGLGIL